MERCLRPASSCVDVGCNRGAILRAMLRFSPQGDHFAFEPIPALVRQLEREFPGVRIFDVALSDHGGESDFQHVVSRPAYSGLRRRRYRGEETIETIRVRTGRLDEIVPADQWIDFIKIDVEGAELEVLRGAAETIRRCRPVIVFEHGLGAAPYYGTRPEQVHELLDDCGLSVSLLHAWLDGGEPLARNAFVEVVNREVEFYFVAHPGEK
jgi:FkbM family methyltransferase